MTLLSINQAIKIFYSGLSGHCKYQKVKEFDDLYDGFDTIPAFSRRRRTDGRTEIVNLDRAVSNLTRDNNAAAMLPLSTPIATPRH